MNGEYVKAQSAEEFVRDAEAWLRGSASAVDEEDARHGVSFRALVRLLTGGEPSEDEATEVLRLKSASPLLANPGSGLLAGVLGLIKPKVRVVPEIAEHLVMQFDPRSPVAMDAQAKVMGQADAGSRLACLAGHFEAMVHWNADHVQEGVAGAAKELGVKVGALMFPLRVAVTGQGHGVDLVPLLVLLGKEETVQRLRHRGPLLTA
jgi:glutamyl/glutaminyl-tRNA synthetase